MEGQVIILTTLNPVVELVKIVTSFKPKKAHAKPKESMLTLELPIHLSPLMTIPDLKSYIVSELESLITVNNSDNLIIWSPTVNIELTHPHKIYTPTKPVNEFHRSEYVINPEIFLRGPIYISGDITVTGSYNYEETFFTKLYREANNCTVNMKIDYINIFRSNFTPLDYYKLLPIVRKLSNDITCTLVLRLNDQLLMTGDIVPLMIPSEYFLIQLNRLVGNNLIEVVNINEKKITVSDSEYFQQLILEVVRAHPEYIIPERYYNSVNYALKLDTWLNTKYNDYENIFMFFQNYETWEADNILQSKNKLVKIFLSSTGFKIKSLTPQLYLAEYTSRIILGYAAIHNKESDVVKFDKIKGIYWSRICQNVGSDIRKPLKIQTDDHSNTEHQVTIDGDVYKCLDNSSNPFIGFLTKPYDLSSICLPCCYQTDQTKKKLYKKCTTKDIISSVDTVYSLFIIDSGRFVGTNRLSFLDEIVDEYLNRNSEIVIDNKMLVSCKNYYLITGNEYIELETISIDRIIDELVKYPQHAIIFNQTFYFSMYYDDTKPITLKTIHKNFIYVIVNVSKNKNSDVLTVHNTYQLEKFIKRNFGINTKNNYEMKTIQHVSNLISLGDIIPSSTNSVIREGQISTIDMTSELNKKYAIK